jgi:hypothetical protein
MTGHNGFQVSDDRIGLSMGLCNYNASPPSRLPPPQRCRMVSMTSLDEAELEPVAGPLTLELPQLAEVEEDRP